MNRVSSVVIVTLLAGLGVGATYLVQQGSASRIAEQQRENDSRHFLDLLPANSYDNHPLEHTLPLAVATLGDSTLQGGFLATRSGQPSAVLLRSQAVGYVGSIDLLIAIDVNGKLLGVKTLRQSETPGLGARIADWPNAWLKIFVGKSMNDPDDKGWALKKDQGQFDQVAGATITSRAVLNAIHDALRYFDEHRQQLLGENLHE